MMKSKSIINKSIFEYFLLFLTGFIGLSTFANVITSRMGFYLIEILIVPLVFFYIRNKSIVLSRRVRFSNIELIHLLFLVFSITLGIIKSGSVFNTITCIRPYIYILIILKYIKDKKIEIDCSKLYTLAVGCALGDFVYTREFSVAAVLRGYQHINIIAIALIIIIPMIQKKNVLSAFSVILSLIISVFSGYRINILIVFVSIISCLMLNIFVTHRIERHLVYIGLLIILYFGILWLIPNMMTVTEYLSEALDLNALTITRSFGRIQSLLNRQLTVGDQNRMIFLLRPFEMFDERAFPSGPIGKSDLVRFGEYTDTPFLFLYDVYGSVLAWVIIVCLAIYFSMSAIKIIRIARIGGVSEYNMVFVAMLPVVSTLFILNGSFLTFVNIAIMFALSIGGFASIE